MAKGCSICGDLWQLVQDHDHGNGLCRGRLCNGCNTGLGFFRDAPELLRRAAEYVEEWRAVHAEHPDRCATYDGVQRDKQHARTQRELKRRRKKKADTLRMQAQGVRNVVKRWKRLGKAKDRPELKLGRAIRALEERAKLALKGKYDVR